MKQKNLLFRIIAVSVLAAFAQWAVLPSLALAQSGNCAFDPDKPSVEHARTSFKMLNYQCAEEELNAYLANDDIGIEEKASAHVLLASVYYAMLKNDSEKRERVTDEFVKAFKAYRDWRGELDIKSGEFLDLMEIAKSRVDDEAAEEVAVEEPPVTEPEEVEIVEETPTEEQEEKPVATITPEEKPKEKKKKAWYTNWWAIAGGVGLVAVAAVALGGGSSDEGPGDLPPIPDHPPDAGK